MPNLPGLTTFSHAQKDELIGLLWPSQQQVKDLIAQMVAMQDRIKQLEGRVDGYRGRNSRFLPLARYQRRVHPEGVGHPV